MRFYILLILNILYFSSQATGQNSAILEEYIQMGLTNNHVNSFLNYHNMKSFVRIAAAFVVIIFFQNTLILAAKQPAAKKAIQLQTFD